MVQSELELIEELKKAAVTPIERSEFTPLYLRALKAFDIKDVEVARVAEKAMGTVIKWRTSIAIPHTKTRPLVFSALLKIVEKRSTGASQKLYETIEASQGHASPFLSQLVGPRVGQKGLAGKRAKLLNVEPIDNSEYPAGLPIDTTEVVILDDSPSPSGVLRVNPSGDSVVIGLVLASQIEVVD